VYFELQSYKKNNEKWIFLLFFVTLHPKIAFIMKKLMVIVLLAGIFTACQESLEDRCARETQEYTKKNCPAKLDNNTTLDSLTFERETHTLHYYYRLTGLADRDSILQEIDAASTLKEELKNTTSLRVYKENKYRFAYTFHSERDPEKVLLEVVFTEKDY
jgi:hypothetical protein